MTKLKERIGQVMPASLVRNILIRKGMNALQRVPELECHADKLQPVRGVDPREVFASSDMANRWLDSKRKLDRFEIPDLTGGINPGDRKAIYYLIRRYNPTSVLEIGTHIGASTLHIAEALYANQGESDITAEFVTVDVEDVNDPIAKPWLRFGATHSPREMVNELGFSDFVEFVRDTSLHYLTTCERKFDFIFLDGDHTASTVYKEIPNALKRLNKGGLILLHDYFPDLKPLWSSGTVIPGPFLATERFRREGADLAVIPLRELPWPTKLQSNFTSLALLLRNH